MVMSTFDSSCSHVGIKETLNKDPDALALGGWRGYSQNLSQFDYLECIYWKNRAILQIHIGVLIIVLH